jgi:mannitol-specific phosphotransferase system IIBC component
MSIPEEGLSEISVCQQAIEQLRTDITGIVGDNTYYYELKRQDYAQNRRNIHTPRTVDNVTTGRAAADYANEWSRG